MIDGILKSDHATLAVIDMVYGKVVNRDFIPQKRIVATHVACGIGC